MIKKIIVYLLSVLMIFAPAYSAYALALPSKGQIIAIGKKGGAMIKTSGGRIVKGGAIGIGIEGARIGIGAAISWCKNNQKKCKDKIGDIAELACDDFECIAETPDDDSHVCNGGRGRIGYQWVSPPPGASLQIRYSGGYLAYANTFTSDIQQHQKLYRGKSVSPNFRLHGDEVDYYGKVGQSVQFDIYISNNQIAPSYGLIVKVCTDDTRTDEQKSNDRRLSEDELNQLAKKIAENMDDDDIINYYNTDYGDIIINNKRYDGDDINSQTNIDNRCNNNSCNEISKEIEQDVRSKKYDIDYVNEQNCTMSNNKYISCKKPDGDTNDDTNKQDEQEKQDEPLTCDSSKFHRKVCDWIDWTQDDLEVPDENNPKIKDLSDDLQIDKNRVNFGRACPAGDNAALSLHGVHISHQISYQGLCDAFTTMRPFIIGIGGIVSVMIIGGRRA